MDLTLKKREYVEQKMKQAQESVDFLYQRNEMQSEFMREAEKTVTRDYVLQQKLEAEKQAGLDKKIVPEEEIPAEVVKQIESQYEMIHQGKKLTGKDRKNVMKQYKKKQQAVASARNIQKAFSAYSVNMQKNLKDIAVDINDGKELSGNERKNLACVAYGAVFTGRTMIQNMESIRSLSINLGSDNLEPQQIERWALEQERLFRVVLNYDMKNLQYKSTADFMKNISEKLAMGQLASEMDYGLSHYRELVEKGKIENPIDPAILNEVEARVEAIMIIHNKNKVKFDMMQSDLYTLMDQSNIDAMTDEEINDALLHLDEENSKKDISREQREKNNRDSLYYKSVLQIRYSKTAKQDFATGDDPEKILNAERKKQKKLHPLKESTLASYSKKTAKSYDTALTDVMEERSMDIYSSRVKMPNGQNYDAVDFAKTCGGNYWKILKENPSLRKHEIQKYYGQLHRNRKIPDEVYERIEKNFMSRYEESIPLNDDEAIEENKSHEKLKEDFSKRFTDPVTGKKEYSSDRECNAALRVYKNSTPEKQLKGYKRFYDLLKADRTKMSKEDIVTLKKDNQAVIDYINQFDINKLCFKKSTDLMQNQKEVTAYIQFASELQDLPSHLYKLGMISENEFLNMESRILFSIDFSGVFQTLIARDRSILHALIDDKDLEEFRKADGDAGRDAEQTNATTVDVDAAYYENVLKSYDTQQEVSQYMLTWQAAKSMLGSIAFKPGEKLEDFMPKYQEIAADKLKKLKQ